MGKGNDFMRKIDFNGNKNIIHKRLRSIRRQKNVTQTQLAARMQVRNINIDQITISKIERNQRIVTDYELAGFCKALHIGVSELLGKTDEFFDT